MNPGPSLEEVTERPLWPVQEENLTSRASEIHRRETAAHSGYCEVSKRPRTSLTQYFSQGPIPQTSLVQGLGFPPPTL